MGILVFVSCPLKPRSEVTDLHFFFFCFYRARDIMRVYPVPRGTRMLQLDICFARLFIIQARTPVYIIVEGKGPQTRPEALRQPGTALPPAPSEVGHTVLFDGYAAACTLQLRLLEMFMVETIGHQDHQRPSPQGSVLELCPNLTAFKLCASFSGQLWLGFVWGKFCSKICASCHVSLLDMKCAEF